MRNVRSSQLKKCIFMNVDDFKEIFIDIFGEYDGDTNEIDVEFNTSDGIYFCAISNQDVYEKLSEYFDVKVTSVHLDDCEYLGVWICYKEEL